MKKVREKDEIVNAWFGKDFSKLRAIDNEPHEELSHHRKGSLQDACTARSGRVTLDLAISLSLLK
jgi:hypothetical protein